MDAGSVYVSAKHVASIFGKQEKGGFKRIVLETRMGRPQTGL
jgi:hypothetical protein